MIKKAFKAALPYTLPVMMGYLFLGTAFGILLSGKGYHFIWAIIMSLFIYAGSMQFVAIGILTAPFQMLNAFLLTLTVNARHILYGLSMINKFKGMALKKPYMVFSLTDETYSLLCGTEPPNGIDKNWFYFFISALNHCYWIIGSAIGACAGSWLSLNAKGIDFAMTALFVVIFIEQWESTKNHISAILGAIASLACLLVFGASNFLIPSMLLIFIILILFRKPIEKRTMQQCFQQVK